MFFFKLRVFFKDKNLAGKQGQYKWFYTQLTEHKLINRENKECEIASDYNWQTCIYSYLSKTVGCKLPWDRISKNTIKSCSEMEKIKKIKKFIDFVVEAEQNELAYETNCPIPCSFREYRTVGDPFTGKNFVFQSNDERFQR